MIPKPYYTVLHWRICSPCASLAHRRLDCSAARGETPTSPHPPPTPFLLEIVRGQCYAIPLPGLSSNDCTWLVPDLMSIWVESSRSRNYIGIIWSRGERPIELSSNAGWLQNPTFICSRNKYHHYHYLHYSSILIWWRDQKIQWLELGCRVSCFVVWIGKTKIVQVDHGPKRIKHGRGHRHHFGWPCMRHLPNTWREWWIWP